MISLFQKIYSGLREDVLLQRVIRNSSYLFSSSAVSAGLSAVQMYFVVQLLSPEAYGLVFGIIMVFASNVNRLLSFRMSEVVVKYVGEALTQDNRDRAAALIKGIGLVEAATSVLAYLVLVALASAAAQTYETSSFLFIYYGLFLLANLVYETSVGVLQTTNRFNYVARANLSQSIAIAILVLIAFLLKRGVFEVLTAYLVGKTIAGLMVSSSAVRELNQRLGSGWASVPLNLLSDWHSIRRFMLSTNLNGTVNLFARDNIPLYIGYFLSSAEVGYFKFALWLIGLVMLPIEPFIWPTYAEITRTIAQRQWDTTRKLLKQVSSISGVWTLFAGGGLIALGWWLIPLIFGSDYSPAYLAVVILLVGYGCANVLNWNRPLLLALGKPTYPLLVAAIVGIVEVVLILVLVPRGNYLTAAAIFSGYLAVSIILIVLRGLMLIKREEAAS
jgi:O-antigen/teichoic acid export membrane protein